MELKDVLHYYIGVDYWTNNSQGNLNAKTLPDVLDHIKRDKGVKLHLRPLSDMIEEDMRDFVKDYVDEDEQSEIYGLSTDGECIEFYCGTTCEWQPDGVAVPVEHKRTIPLFQFTPHEFHFLLQRGYDLFDLIPSGLAVYVAGEQGEGSV